MELALNLFNAEINLINDLTQERFIFWGFTKPCGVKFTLRKHSIVGFIDFFFFLS